jgi:phospholipid transport system substrate-binding protein
MTTIPLSPCLPSRRWFLALAGVGAPLALSVTARADNAAANATVFMTRTIQELTVVVNGPGGMPEKAAALQKIIDRTVDVSSVGRFCLGRFWRLATPDEQKQYMDLFHRVLMRNITSKVGDYAGVDITIQRTAPRDDGVVVTSSVVRPNAAPAKVDWLVSQDSGAPLIIDVIAEGTSLRLTQRNDYSAFLSRNNNSIAALIDALKQQANTDVLSKG